MEAIAGREAIKKPAEVKTMEKVPIVTMRRKRARLRGAFEDALQIQKGQLVRPDISEQSMNVAYQDLSCNALAMVSLVKVTER